MIIITLFILWWWFDRVTACFGTWCTSSRFTANASHNLDLTGFQGIATCTCIMNSKVFVLGPLAVVQYFMLSPQRYCNRLHTSVTLSPKALDETQPKFESVLLTWRWRATAHFLALPPGALGSWPKSQNLLNIIKFQLQSQFQRF